MAERKPFHESIVDVLNGEGNASIYKLDLLAEILTSTKIPKNHDAIIAAWRERVKETGDEDDSLAYVLADLENQKREAEAEARAKEDRKLAKIIADARECCD